MTLPPPPPVPPSKKPPRDETIALLDYWYYEMGRNPIPVVTGYRTGKKGFEWKEWQAKSLPEELFNQWKLQDAYADGVAIPAGMSWRGPHKGEYLIFLDLDNQKAVDEFLAVYGDEVTLQDLAQKFIVEQHLDNTHKAHVYFFSEIPFPKKSSDKSDPTFDAEHLPDFEVKGQGFHGVAFCTPSFHKGGHQYQILGIKEPVTLSKKQAEETIAYLEWICKKYDLKYRDKDNDNGLTVTELVKEGSVIIEGHNRHKGLMQMGMSLVSSLGHKWPRSTIKEMVFRAVNDIYCKPPIDRQEFERNIWKSIERYLPPDKKQAELAAKHLHEITSDTGVDPNKVLEKPLADVINKTGGDWVISNVKVVGMSPPYKLISRVTLRCKKCGHTETEDYSKMPLMSYRQTKKMCNACVDKNGKPVSDLSDSYDHAHAKSITLQDAGMQEDLDRLHVILLDDLTRNVRVGETVTITGQMTVLNPTGAGGRKPQAAMYARYVKSEREEEAPITDDDIMLFQSFAKEHGTKTPYELVKMFAPQVKGHSDAKLGILRSAVNVKETKHLTGIRSRTHTNLVGDPGTAKSTLAQEATKIVPNSRYVTAQHASIKSVLAIIDKDPDGGKMLMLGPVPQARNALCGINEMGSMVFEDQQHLADVFEEGKFTIDKHGIYQGIDCPTTIIATTNPEGGYWNGTPSLDKIPIRSNIRDRFDQTYIFQDFQTDEERREYAVFKAEYYQNPESAQPNYGFLKRYIQYAALLPDPSLTPEAGTMLSDFWMRMSRAGHSSNRNYDSLIRIARGQARLQLKAEIDAEVARQVMQDMQLMFVKLGKIVDPSVENPIEMAYNLVIQYTYTLQAPITLEEALKHVASSNNSVKQYLGGNNIDWSIDRNKRYRHIHDRFADDAVIGHIRTGRNGLAVTIDKLKPLTIVKSDKETAVVKQHHQQQQQQEVENEKSSQDMRSNRSDRSVVKKDIEESKRGFPVTDSTDPTDRPSEVGQFNIDIEVGKYMTSPKPYQLVEKAMRYGQGDNKGFTKDDWVFTCQMWSNLHWTVKQSEQALERLLKEGKIVELESGRYGTTEELRMSEGVD